MCMDAVICFEGSSCARSFLCIWPLAIFMELRSSVLVTVQHLQFIFLGGDYEFEVHHKLESQAKNYI